ncbi:MAG TPA: pyrimidine reductase family protein [Galbitalea sp.]|jgi:riboflavin biosynthesis pyrimidine reductase
MVEITSLLPGLAGALDDAAIADHYSAHVGEPWLRVNFVASVDGAATLDGTSAGLGGEADHRVFDILRTLCDVVLVASGTVKAEGYGAMIVDDASVSARVAAGLAPQPVFAIVSGSLDLDPASAVFGKAPVRPLVFTVESAPPNGALAEVADIIVCGQTTVDGARMVAELASRGLTRIHCEGGPHLFGALVAHGVVDEVCVTVSPLLVGGSGERIAQSETATPHGMRLAGILRSEDTLLLRYTRGPASA